MLGCFFGRKPPPEIEFLLRVLDTTDLMDLADLYGEARDRFQDKSLMEAVNKRMGEAIAEFNGKRNSGIVTKESPDADQA